MDYAFREPIRALLRSSTSISEISRKSGISRTTLYSWLRGDNQPRIELLNEALLTIGYAPVVELRTLSDGAAATAARMMLGDSALSSTPGAQEWVERFEKWNATEKEDLVRAAHQASNPLHRAGTVHFLGSQMIRVASAADASSQRWALSESDDGAIVWCEDPHAVAALLPARVRQSPEPVLGGTSLVAATGSELDGRNKQDGIYRVAELQNIIDWNLHG